MFNASQAVQLSQSFDQEAQYQKMHDSWIDNIESLVRSKAKAGETSLDWVPCINHLKKSPQVVCDRAMATLNEAGYKVIINQSTGIWAISWA